MKVQLNSIIFQNVASFLQEGIKSGIVQPLSHTTFSSEKAEEAFRYMSAGKHIGKVKIKKTFNFVNL